MTYQFKSITDCEAHALTQPQTGTNTSPLKMTHDGLPDGIKPLAITDLLESLRGKLQLRDEDLAYLRLMMRKLRREDFLPGRICVVWESVTHIADQLGLLTRQINRIEQRLIRADLIAKTSSGNGFRFGRRRADGVIEIAAGINFAPLINRMPDIIAYHRLTTVAANQLKTSRRTAADLIAQIRALKADEALRAARAALPRLRPSEINDLKKIEAVIDALEAILADFSTTTGQTVEAARSDSLDRPYTKTVINTKTCTRAENEERPSRNVRTTPAQVHELASEQFAEILTMYKDGIEPGQAMSWRVICTAAADFAQMQGISGADWANWPRTHEGVQKRPHFMRVLLCA
ncbi:helix-turn-helix domain-containing protein [Yoonia vestfoldensis]|uniref:Replication protein C n=1 Tax=Yoonia vestfoldensis TaxID=245188 RepID=A0A1Y0EHL8_9RHOB|nr:helix-turn-helix domain-containing protein [Yoonia vestfoldensis]ARU03117.1 replication protein C [Yoonia vestfoldensis]